MIVCNRCGKENQDHYKFCLGCGADITPKAGSDVGMMKTMMADTSGGLPRGAVVPSIPRPGASQPPPVAHHPPAMPPPGPLGPPTAPPPMGAPMGPPPGVPGFSTGMPPAAGPAGARKCPACSTEVPPGFRFCGSCGFRMEESVVQAMPAMPPVLAAPRPAATRITLIRPDGSEGGVHDLRPGENKIGRQYGPLFETDGYLSPTHGEIVIYPGQGGLVRDLGSLNGIFVKMQVEEELLPGQIIRIGQELLRFELVPVPEASPDGTEIMGSPNPGFWGRLVLLVGNGIDGPAYPLIGDAVTVGRDRGEINFPDDGYVSGLHARISLRAGRVYLIDLGSSNGTFMKVNGERPVGPDSFILFGQQLFRLSM